MRYRAEDASGDYVFGPGSSFLINTPAAVAQAVKTRLKLFAREWFLDDRIGLDKDLILGYGTQGTRDFEVQRRIVETPGVTQLVSYKSTVDEMRGFTVTAVVETAYGTAEFTETF